MTPRPLLRGELQEEIMGALWRRGEGTVDAVRDALPVASRSGYRTVQTVLNRLADRGLLTRDKQGNALVYRPTVTEAEYIAATVADTLEGASPEARRLVLAQLSDAAGENDVDSLRALAKKIERLRRVR
jgi:BlaI family transcriptional regulator, penicillinase repressor